MVNQGFYHLGTAPSVIRELMQDAGIAFRKEYGQNFLVNRMIPEDIADNCTDNTAQTASDAGAIVYERFNTEKVASKVSICCNSIKLSICLFKHMIKSI